MTSIARDLIGPLMTIEDLVLNVVTPFAQPACDLAEQIEIDFGIKVTVAKVREACRGLEESGHIVRDKRMPGVEWKLVKKRRAA